MPVTRRRTAAAVVVEVEEERGAAIDISSDSEVGPEWRSEEDSESEEEEDTSDEDFVNISDSDSEAGDWESSGKDSEEESGEEAEAEADQLGADRSEVACNKIAGLLQSNRHDPPFSISLIAVRMVHQIFISTRYCCPGNNLEWWKLR